MLKLTIHDEVNCELEGLTRQDIDHIIKKTELPVPGAFQTAAFKTGNWNGKQSMFSDDGLFFSYMLDQVLDILELDLKYDLDTVEFVDLRRDYSFDIPQIDDTFLLEEDGRNLRTHQVEGINKAIEEKKGIFEYSTSSGKSLLALGISKAFSSYLKSIVVVPSENLVKQTYADYAKSDLDCIAMTAKVKPKDRKQKFKDHDHIIITNKLLMNCADMIDGDDYLLIVDEAHAYMGEVFSNLMRFQLRNCPVRIGLTATVPTDRLKKENLFCHVGGSVIDIVSPAELMEKNYAASINIRMVETSHPEIEEFAEDNPRWDWEMESKYLATNAERVNSIASYLQSLETKNTLVLCHPRMGINLSKYFGGRMIIDETPVDTRSEWLSEFESGDGVTLCASYATSGTGLSINRIHRVVLIDVGKNKSILKQSIGRGMRLSENNDVEVIDICAKTKYSTRHRKERLKTYKGEAFDYSIESTPIVV